MGHTIKIPQDLHMHDSQVGAHRCSWKRREWHMTATATTALWEYLCAAVSILHNDNNVHIAIPGNTNMTLPEARSWWCHFTLCFED